MQHRTSKRAKVEKTPSRDVVQIIEALEFDVARLTSELSALRREFETKAERGKRACCHG